MKTLKSDAIEKTEGDLVLREIWRIKDELSAARGHSIDRLFAEARERQKHSGHRVVNLQRPRKARANAREK
jgi:hypothetical protein